MEQLVDNYNNHNSHNTPTRKNLVILFRPYDPIDKKLLTDNYYHSQLKNFFPSPEERQAVDRVIRKGNEMIDLLRKKGLAKVEETDLEEETDKILALFGKISTNSPESSELTPQTSPSEN